MNASIFYALRDFRKKPKQFSALICVTVFVMLSVSFFLIFLQCQLLLDITEESINNYHIRFRYLSTEDANDIARKKEVLYCYKNYIKTERNGVEQEVLELRIRLKPEYAKEYSGVAHDILYDTGLINHSSYSHYRGLHKLKSDVYNYDYVLKTTTPYVLMPSTLIVIFLFSVFLGSSVVLLFHEKYERSVREYGTLRAIGMRKRDIVVINLVETFLVQLVSMPPAMLLSIGAFKLFSIVSSSLNDDVITAFMNDIPFATIITVMIAISLGALGGSGIVCSLLYDRTAIELIRGEQQQNVSFVSKTSDRFESASSPAIYTRLYTIRMRQREMLNAISLAVTMPLPLYFILLSIDIMNVEDTSPMHALFTVFIAIMLSCASLLLTACTTSYHTMWRKREFGILRLIGASKARIYGLVLPGVIVSALLGALPGGCVTIYAYEKIMFAEADIVLTNVAVEGMQHYTKDSILTLLLYSFIAAILILIVPSVIGAVISLLRSLKRSITDSIREIE